MAAFIILAKSELLINLSYLIVKPTIKFTLSNMARLGNLASKVVLCFRECPSIFGIYYKIGVLPILDRG